MQYLPFMQRLTAKEERCLVSEYIRIRDYEKSANVGVSMPIWKIFFFMIFNKIFIAHCAFG